MGATSGMLSAECQMRLDFLFSDPVEREYVGTILDESCGRNLPGCERSTESNLDRIRFAILKLSEGSLQKFDLAVRLAETDFRDLLVAADFAESVDSYLSWDPRSGAA